MTAIFIRRPPRDVKGRQDDQQPGQNQVLVPKRGTNVTSVAWTRILKHCSLIQTDFKPLKHKQQNVICVRRLCVCVREACFFRFICFEQLHKHTYMRQNTRFCKYPYKHSDLCLKRENGTKRKRICNSRYIGSGVLSIGPTLSDFATSH